VVIPVFNRLDVLRRVLLAINKQSLQSESFEVILVDDGSGENLTGVLNSLKLPYPIKLLKQAHLGPAAARNFGAKQSQGEVIVFLDSDMIVTPSFLTEHLHCHQSGHHDNVVGNLVVGPRYIDSSGLCDPLEMLDYFPDGSDLRLQKQPITYQEAFTCNLSIHKGDWQKSGGFDERLVNSFEDIEFAYRAVSRGMKIQMAEKAIAYHEHPQNFKDRCQQAMRYSQTVPLLFQLHPELCGQINHLRDKEPINWKADPPGLLFRKSLRRLLAIRPVLQCMEMIVHHLTKKKISRKLLRFFYWKAIGSYQLIGLRSGIKLYGWKCP
jgi:glycosyltransferase involved in cell wall biosynthesis